MALINCPECGRQVSDKALSCPNCGYPISSVSSAPEIKKPREVKVFFHRDSAFKGSAIKGIVLIDDKRVGTINNGESFSTMVSVGKHSLTIEESSNNQTVDIGAAMFFGYANIRSTNNVKISTLNIPDDAESVNVEIVVVFKSGLEVGSISVKRQKPVIVQPKRITPESEMISSNMTNTPDAPDENSIVCKRCGTVYSITRKGGKCFKCGGMIL